MTNTKNNNDCVAVSIAKLTGVRKNKISSQLNLTKKGVKTDEWVSKQKQLGIHYEEYKKPKYVTDIHLQAIAKKHKEGVVFRVKDPFGKSNQAHLMHMNQKGKLTAGENRALKDKLLILTGVITKAK